MDPIRRATIEDSEAIAHLATLLGYPSDSEQTGALLVRLLLDGAHAIFVYELDETVIGWVHVSERQTLVNAPYAEVLGLIAHPDYRNRGVGKSLMRSAEIWATARGLHRLRLRTNVVRKEAHAFYERIGYSFVKEQKLYERKL